MEYEFCQLALAERYLLQLDHSQKLLLADTLNDQTQNEILKIIIWFTKIKKKS